MDFSGIVIPFQTNRPLTEMERVHQLHQKRRLDIAPRYQQSVIRLNSTYLESVDKWHGWKGMVSAITFAVFLIFAVNGAQMAGLWLLEAAGILHSTLETGVLLANGLAMTAVVGLVTWLCIRVLRKESFAYTHYPLRFNRKSRMVYVWRIDGTVLAVRWDDVFFTLAYVGGAWEVRGHVLAADNSTIVESFALSYSGVLTARDLDPATTRYSDQDFVRGHWEFVRRYMEDGPPAVAEHVGFCMPLDGRRETAMGGIHRVLANFSGGSWVMIAVMAPFCVLIGVARIFAMRTSRIPQWPAEIDAACAVEVGDPYAIAGDSAGNRVAVYPEAAEAAGVVFTGRPVPQSRLNI